MEHEGPLVIGLGFDFAVLWATGKAVLAGLNPYGVWGAFYPPATSYLFAAFALLPVTVAFVLWTVANVASLAAVVGIRRAPVWLFFAPVTMALAAGQVDLPLLAAATLLGRRNWQAIAAAVLITLKPQVAAIVLPWHLVRWPRRQVAVFAGAAAVVHLAPVALAPRLGLEWLARVTNGGGRAGASPGLWSLYTGEGLVLFLAVAAIIFAASLRLREPGGRAGAILASPAAMLYDVSALAGSAPAWVLVPLSWVALGLAHSLNSFAPQMLIPLVALAWNLPTLGLDKLFHRRYSLGWRKAT